jgi:hypothetical protein
MPEQDWEEFRRLLKELLRDPAVKQRVEQRADIAPRTLTRWVSGETEVPDRKRLLSLLAALPQHREALLSAVVRAIPDFEPPLFEQRKNLVEEFPVDFWLRVLETNSNTPNNLRFSAVVDLVFLQLQSAIDPMRTGVRLVVAQCSPPASCGQPSRSLREIVKIRTHHWLSNASDTKIFLGAESLAGYSVSHCRAHVVQNVEEEQRLPVRRTPDELSAAAYPIQRGGSVAGCFLVSSPQPHFFSQRLEYLLQVYTYLLSIAFELQQFYPPEQICLQPMPTEGVQYRYLAAFHQRVMHLLKQDRSLSQPQAEVYIWQQVEEELLQTLYHDREEHSHANAKTN